MVMLEIGARPALAEGAEGVDITLARAAPADELDADPKARHRRAHEPGLVEAPPVVEILAVRSRPPAHPARADPVPLEPRDVITGSQQTPTQPPRHHPAPRTPAPDCTPNRARQ